MNPSGFLSSTFTGITSKDSALSSSSLTSLYVFVFIWGWLLVFDKYKLIFKLNLEMASKRKVNMSDYDLLQTLGTGLFGRVRLAKEKATGKYYAL